ncbi:TPA: hypothetical protein ACQRM3_005257 [Pseudomonas aeruginosa]|uniref:hypothetical protein n=1 Tax=Pseudomonas aeruginosa TaxID=287 RepID=UPI0012985EC7|nr:hypothetical protein [Pseudomonas aeruginosa]NPS65738.1 hypothetical protein [Pseudomonas aeruginosa]HCF0972776.1 hypothetical protein [Pseudomonas aeruginosa]HDU8953970.1 hypothetical protein [Pseudomonas aeruginosa]
MAELKDAKEGFFSSTKVKQNLRTFILKTSSEDISPNPEVAFVKDFITKSLQLMLDHEKEFNSLCTFNIKMLGDALTSTLTLASIDPNRNLFISLFSICYRFLAEFEFNLNTENNDITSTLNSIRFGEQKLPAEFENSVRYAELFMPAKILKDAQQDPSLSSIKEFNENIQKLPELQKEIKKDLDNREKRVTDLRAALQEYKYAYNFIGLYDGFNSLAEQKRRMAWAHVIGLVIIGILMLLPASIKLYSLIASEEHLNTNLSLNVQLIISVAAIELLLLYFFRVILQSLRSIRGQLLQLDLRRSICRFIQSYAEYAADINKNNAPLLDRFEALIFSGIVAQEDNIPSTFDGMEHLTKLIESARK